MSDAFRGQWVVVLRDIPANEDEILGPYHSEENAQPFTFSSVSTLKDLP